MTIIELARTSELQAAPKLTRLGTAEALYSGKATGIVERESACMDNGPSGQACLRLGDSLLWPYNTPWHEAIIRIMIQICLLY